jgi:RNA polymerase sigma-70 factor, ECF subfamily
VPMANVADFEKTALPHIDAVYRAALAICGRQDTAEDLVQAAYAKALAAFASYEAGTNCRAWLLQILRRTWLDELRHRRVAGPAVAIDDREVAAKDEAEEPVWTDPAGVLECFSDEQVIAALLALPEDQRLALLLTEVMELSHDEVAEIMGVAAGTIKSRTSRARAAMKKVLAAHARDLGFMGKRS